MYIDEKDNMDRKELSGAETIVMKAVWDEGKDLSVRQLIAKLESDYGRRYQRTTVVTFLGRMAEKGFVETYRVGKLAYVHAICTEEEYRDYILNKDMKLWCGGRVSHLVSALLSRNRISEAESEEIRRLLDGMDH